MTREMRIEARNKKIMEFMHDHGDAALQFACGLVHDRAEAQDLLQETLCRVMRSWKKRDERRPIRGWVFSILKNKFIDSHRRRCRHVAFANGVQHMKSNGAYWDHRPIMTDGAFLEELVREESLGRIRAALDGMRPNYKSVVYLRDIEGNTYGEVAGRLRLPIGTVRSRLHRARKALRHCVEAMEMKA